MKVRVIENREVLPPNGIAPINTNGPGRFDLLKENEWCCKRMAGSEKWVGREAWYPHGTDPNSIAPEFFISVKYYGYERSDPSGSVRVDVSFCPWCGAKIELDIEVRRYRTVWKQEAKTSLAVDRIEYLDEPEELKR